VENNIGLRLKNIIIGISRLNITEDDIREETDFINDLGFDSVNMIQLLVQLEKELDICFEGNELALDGLTDFKGLKERVQEKLNTAAWQENI